MYRIRLKRFYTGEESLIAKDIDSLPHAEALVRGHAKNYYSERVKKLKGKTEYLFLDMTGVYIIEKQ